MRANYTLYTSQDNIELFKKGVSVYALSRAIGMMTKEIEIPTDHARHIRTFNENGKTVLEFRINGGNV